MSRADGSRKRPIAKKKAAAGAPAKASAKRAGKADAPKKPTAAAKKRAAPTKPRPSKGAAPSKKAARSKKSASSTKATAPKKGGARASGAKKAASSKRGGRAREAWTTLVTVEQLAARIGDADLLVLDVRHDLKDPTRGPKLYAEGHIPGALHAHVDHDLSSPPRKGTGRHPLPDVDAFVETCRRWGIDENVQVVCYDDWGGAWASRAWWLLRHYGHRNVAVLDGGIQAWTAAGHALTTEVPTREPRRFFGHPVNMPTVTTWDLMTRQPRCLVDARAPTRYRGDEEPVDPKGGHIPHAKNVPFTSNVGDDGRFLPRDALRTKYERLLDGLPATEAAFYCGSGVTAPHDILAMEIAGLPGAALYPGSWSEWVQNDFRPVATGDEP